MADKSELRRRVGKLAGEFLLIVTGVAVALAADGWREEAEDQIAAEVALDLLLADLATDLSQLTRLRDNLAQRDTLVAQVVMHLGDPSFPTDSAQSVLRRLRTWRDYSPSRSSFDYLIQRDALRRVGDEALQSDIVLYFEQHQARLTFGMNEYFLERLWVYVQASEPYQVPKADSLVQALDWRSHELLLTETWDVIRRDNELMMSIYTVGAAGSVVGEQAGLVQAANIELQSALRSQRGGG